MGWELYGSIYVLELADNWPILGDVYGFASGGRESWTREMEANSHHSKMDAVILVS
jgi:hypothetical protein